MKISVTLILLLSGLAMAAQQPKETTQHQTYGRTYQ